MKARHILLSIGGGVVLNIAAAFIFPVVLFAQELGTVHYYATPDEYHRDAFEWRLFFENQHREPCQHYVEPPEGFAVIGCNLTRLERPQAAAVSSMESVTTIEPAAGGSEPAAAPTVASYTVYFDFDRFNIRPSENMTLQNAAAEIRQASPTTVTVAGHADAAGPNDYNDALSQRRADAVRQALVADGVSSDIVNTQAYGENNLAVQTADGVALQDNRRVVIDFQK